MAKPQSDQPEIIYSMMRVSKIYNNKPVIKDISLSYFYGAKIGVLGLNGSGKSTVLRIMAGVDQDFNGEAVLSKGYTTGILDQEPQLDPDRTVREIVEEGAAEKVAWLKEYNAISDQFADPEADMDALLAKQGGPLSRMVVGGGAGLGAGLYVLEVSDELFECRRIPKFEQGNLIQVKIAFKILNCFEPSRFMGTH